MTREPNVVFVSTHLGHVRGGAEINDLRLGTALQSLGANVSYITLRDSNKEFLSLDAPLRSVTCPYWYDRSYGLPTPIGKIIRHLNEELFVHRVQRRADGSICDADLILTTGRPILVRVGKVTNATLFHSVRGRVHPLYDRYLERPDGLIFWGGCEREYSTDTGVQTQPAVTLDPAVDTDLFRRLPEDDIPAIGPSGSIVVGFVGRLEPVKRVDRIIEAVATLQEKHSLYLLVIGDGSRREDLETIANDRLPPGSFKFTGRLPQENLAAYLNAIDIFVLSSSMENHPIALKEAIACGTFCIAPDVGRVSEIITSDTGIVYRPNEKEALIQCLDRVLESDQYRRVGREERARSFDTWRDNAREVLDLYHSLN